MHIYNGALLLLAYETLDANQRANKPRWLDVSRHFPLMDTNRQCRKSVTHTQT